MNCSQKTANKFVGLFILFTFDECGMHNANYLNDCLLSLNDSNERTVTNSHLLRSCNDVFIVTSFDTDCSYKSFKYYKKITKFSGKSLKAAHMKVISMTLHDLELTIFAVRLLSSVTNSDPMISFKRKDHTVCK